jgi:hypothetical protein
MQRYLKYELKSGKDDKVARTRFELALMLSGLALIHHERTSQKEPPHQSENEDFRRIETVEGQVAKVTQALAPFLLPMIDALGALDEEQVASSSRSGEST